MSGQPVLQQPDRACTYRIPQVGSQREDNSQVYLHSVTDAQAAVLTESKCQEIEQKIGANVKFDPNPSDVQNTNIVGSQGPSVQEEVTLISEETGIQETISAQAQTFWQQWVEAGFPDLESRAYFLPPVYCIRVSSPGQFMVLGEPSDQSTHGQVDQSNQPAINQSDGNESDQLSHVQDSDFRDDAITQRVLFCLKKMSDENREVLVGLSQLQFGQYLGEPCYAAAAAHLPVAKSFDLPKNRQGDFDVLLIHRQHGIVVCEVKAFGDNVSEFNTSQQDVNNNIRSKLTDAVSKLDKAEAILSHLVSDVTPGVRITKTIVVPNLTVRQVQQAISGDPELKEELCRCLRTTDPADIAGLCLCSDQLSDPKTPWDVSSDVLRELGNWWQRRVTVSGPDSHMTSNNYKRLVARICGPATTVTVPCISPPRLCVKTLGQVVSWTGACYTAQITLFPEQVRVLNTAHNTVFLTGPPGTGKTVVLLLMATEWLKCGNDVYIVCTWFRSLTVCCMLYHLLRQIVNTQLMSGISFGQPHLLQYDFEKGRDVEKAVTELSLAARRGSLYVIADEVFRQIKQLWTRIFCDKLLRQVPHLRLWAASYYHNDAPIYSEWNVESFTRPIRFPPAIVREVQQDMEIKMMGSVQAYKDRKVADHTDGPPVRWLYHRGQGHTDHLPHDCVTCGREVASFLHSLRVPDNPTASPTAGTFNSGTESPSIQWRDIMVLCCYDYAIDRSGVVRGLREAGIPVRVMTNDDIEDVVTARSDVVWVASGLRICGLERKVVVCLDQEFADLEMSTIRLRFMSRCTLHLAIVSLAA